MLKGFAAAKSLTPQVKVHIFYPYIGSDIRHHLYMGIKAKKYIQIPYIGYQS